MQAGDDRGWNPPAAGAGVGALRALLLGLGEELGEFLPWHSERDPFRVLVAEKLLQRTARRNVAKVYPGFIARFGSPAALAEADPAELRALVGVLGLGNQRARALRDIARTVLEAHGGRVPDSREALLAIPHVGEYIADAVLLYGHGRHAFPLDNGVQRVLRRASGLPPARKPPYADGELAAAAGRLVGGVPPGHAVRIHRAVLWLAWEKCRPREPRCGGCPAAARCAAAGSRPTEHGFGRP